MREGPKARSPGEQAFRVWPQQQWRLHRLEVGGRPPGLALPPTLPALGPRGVCTGQADTSASSLGRSPSHTCARKPPALGSRAVSVLSLRKVHPCAWRCRGVHVLPCSSGEAQHPLVVRGLLPQRGRSCVPFSLTLPSHLWSIPSAEGDEQASTPNEDVSLLPLLNSGKVFDGKVKGLLRGEVWGYFCSINSTWQP